MLVFARVVQAGSFTTAAAELGMPKSTVSRKVSELEERLKSRLLQRTTRKLSLTDVGRTYYDYCARIVGEIEDAERAVSSLQETPRGLLARDRSHQRRLPRPDRQRLSRSATRTSGSSCSARDAPWTSSRNASTWASERERSRTRR